MVLKKGDTYWCLIAPLRIRLSVLGRQEWEHILRASLEEAIATTEQYLASFPESANGNFRRTPAPFHTLMLDERTHERLVNIVNTIGPRAWEDIATHTIMKRLGM